jgi:hypothetical protein
MKVSPLHPSGGAELHDVPVAHCSTISASRPRCFRSVASLLYHTSGLSSLATLADKILQGSIYG